MTFPTPAGRDGNGNQDPAQQAGPQPLSDRRAPPPPASRPSPPGGLRPALTPAQHDHQLTDPSQQRRRTRRRLLRRAPTPGLRPGPTSPQPNKTLDGSTLHRYADLGGSRSRRRRHSVWRVCARASGAHPQSTLTAGDSRGDRRSPNPGRAGEHPTLGAARSRSAVRSAPPQVIGGSMTWGASTMTVIEPPKSPCETITSYSPGGGGAMMKLMDSATSCPTPGSMSKMLFSG